MSEAKETRVSMNWPEDLREEVRQLVGARGTTAFTIEAVKEKLARHRAGASETTEVPEAQPAPVAPTPSKAAEPAPVAMQAEAQEGEAGERGPVIDVAPPPTLGVAAKFNSSGDAVLELLNRAQEMGMKRASEIPAPVRDEAPAVEDAPSAEEAVEEPVEAAPTPEPEPEPEPEPTPDPIPAPVVSRDLDDIEVGF